MRPYTVCYMMTSVDGRIDCAMTSELKGVEEYYRILGTLDVPSTLSGRRTAELEMALPGRFEAKDPEVYGMEGSSKKVSAPGYEIVVDSKGTLLWEKETSTDKPHLIITGTKVTKEYLDYLDGLNISWIVCGGDRVDLAKAVQTLAERFGVKRLGIVGGPEINTAFLEVGLLDEIVLLIGPGIDGRAEMPSVFEGKKDLHPLPLELIKAETCGDGTVLLRYRIRM